MASTRKRPIAVIQSSRCTGCGWCVPSCPFNLLSLEVQNWRKTSTLSQPEACTGCGLCVSRCPFKVISMQPRFRAGLDAAVEAGPEAAPDACLGAAPTSPDPEAPSR